jgi:WD40 repeat protein
VGTSKDQPRVRLCSGFNVSLPENWQATTPETLRYVVAVISTSVEVGQCQYSSVGGIGTTIKLTRLSYTIIVYDSITGAAVNQRVINGTIPTCTKYVFSKPTDQIGSGPSSDEMQNVVMNLLSPLLPAPRFVPTATSAPSCSQSFVLKGNTSEVNGFSFSQDGTLLMSAYNDGMVKVWNVAEKREVRTLDYAKFGFDLSPDDKMLAWLSEDREVKLWGVDSGSEIRTLETSEIGDVHKLAFLSDVTLVAFGDLAMKFWDVVSGNEVRTLELEGFYNYGVLSPNSKMMALEERGNGTNTYILKLWDMVNEREVRALLEGNEHDGEFRFAFSPDGKWLVARQAHGSTVNLWDVASGSEISVLNINDVDSMVFSPVGTLLALVSNNKVKLWDIASGSEVRTLDINVDSVVFSPDGILLALVSQDGVKLWDIASGSEVRTLDINVDSVVFSPDGTLLASVSQDEVKLWSMASGKEICRLEGDKIINIISFSPNGTLLASGSWDGIVRLWKINSP